MTKDLEKRIYKGFISHAIATVEHDGFRAPVAFVATEGGSFTGVVTAKIVWSGLHIQHLYVEEYMRGKGLGSKLMDRVHTFGREQGCTFAFVETLSFQALEFYQKLGYQIEFTRDGYSNGVSFHYLQKKLSE